LAQIPSCREVTDEQEQEQQGEREYERQRERWRLAEVFGRPEDYFAQVIAKMAAQRLLGLNASRANPACIGHSMTGFIDHGLTGEGLTRNAPQLKTA
jgi:hypothetical protein